MFDSQSDASEEERAEGAVCAGLISLTCGCCNEPGRAAGSG